MPSLETLPLHRPWTMSLGICTGNGLSIAVRARLPQIVHTACFRNVLEFQKTVQVTVNFFPFLQTITGRSQLSVELPEEPETLLQDDDDVLLLPFLGDG
jgi:hypothetical protein